jgi:hypothetical protein
MDITPASTNVHAEGSGVRSTLMSSNRNSPRSFPNVKLSTEDEDVAVDEYE